MTHRRRPLPFETPLLLAARLPCWLSLALAVAVWLLLHDYVAHPPARGGDPARLASANIAGFLHALAGVAQYLLPLLLLGVAAASLYGRLRRQRLLAASAPGGLAALDGHALELLLGAVYRRKGFVVGEPDGSPHGGADLRLLLGTAPYLLQYRHWRAGTLGLAALQELHAAMTASGAVGGFLVGAGGYSAEAQACAAGYNIQLVDGAQLERWLAEERRAASAVALEGGEGAAVPFCPLCSASMVLRTAKRGASAGTRFWGCRRYPVCHGLRRVEPPA